MRAADSLPAATDALRAIIEACMDDQLRRLGLARPLNFEEARVPLDADLRRSGADIHSIAMVVLARPDLPRRGDDRAAEDPEPVAHDVTAVVRGMIDAAGERRESDRRRLVDRVGRAVAGYLGIGP